MAYPSVSAPYGMRPVKLIGGQVFAGSTRLFAIATNSSTAIYYGDVVKLASGVLVKDTGTDSATPVGVFLGCTYTDPTFGKTFRQYYPGTTNITDVQAYVEDDPDALFKVAVVSTGTTISYVASTVVGKNAVLVQNSGVTASGDATNGISSTTATTNTWPLRIISVVPETQVAAGSYTEVIVKWNAGMHQYYTATGA